MICFLCSSQISLLPGMYWICPFRKFLAKNIPRSTYSVNRQTKQGSVQTTHILHPMSFPLSLQAILLLSRYFPYLTCFLPHHAFQLSFYFTSRHVFDMQPTFLCLSGFHGILPINLHQDFNTY